MSDKNSTPAPATDFIRNIISGDLDSGKHLHIVTRFHPNQMGICTLAMQNQYA